MRSEPDWIGSAICPVIPGSGHWIGEGDVNDRFSPHLSFDHPDGCPIL